MKGVFVRVELAIGNSYVAGCQSLSDGLTL